MHTLADVKLAFKSVYRRPLYWVISIIVTLFIFSFNLLVINYELVFDFFNPAFIWGLLRGSFQNMVLSGQIVLISMAILAGILVSLLVFKLRAIKETMGGAEQTGVAGIIFGVLVPACSSCGIGLLALLGYGSLLGVLPFHGIELGVIGIALLLAAILYISSQIANTYCRL